MAIYNCRFCGAIIPYGDSRICPNCARQRAAEQQWQSSGKQVQPNAVGAGCLAALAKPLLKLLKGFGILLVISAVIWAILFFTVDTYKIDYTVAKASTRTADQFEDFLLGFDGKRDVWEIRYEEKVSNLFGRLSRKSKASCTIRYNKGETAPHTTFVFEGEDLGTGLSDGTYILTKLDGADVLIDGENKRIYKADSEFYITNAPKLLAITHDTLLEKVLEQTEGGDHGLVETDPPTEAIFTDEAAIVARLVRNDPEKLMDHGFEARCHIGGDQWAVYRFTYNYQNAIRDISFDGYTVA